MIHLLVDRCGFVGENEPRVIIPSKLEGIKKGEEIYLHEYSTKKELHFNLVKFLHYIFFKYDDERKVTIVKLINFFADICWSTTEKEEL